MNTYHVAQLNGDRPDATVRAGNYSEAAAIFLGCKPEALTFLHFHDVARTIPVYVAPQGFGTPVQVADARDASGFDAIGSAIPAYKLPKTRTGHVTDPRALAAYFAVGATVPSYGGGTDSVLEFYGPEGDPAGWFSVVVRGEDGRIRSHRTAPTRATFEVVMRQREGR